MKIIINKFKYFLFFLILNGSFIARAQNDCFSVEDIRILYYYVSTGSDIVGLRSSIRIDFKVINLCNKELGFFSFDCKREGESLALYSVVNSQKSEEYVPISNGSYNCSGIMSKDTLICGVTIEYSLYNKSLNDMFVEWDSIFRNGVISYKLNPVFEEYLKLDYDVLVSGFEIPMIDYQSLFYFDNIEVCREDSLFFEKTIPSRPSSP